MFDIGYINYLVILLVGTGILILRFDVKGYQIVKLKKETKVSKFIGWTNVGLGIFLLVGNSIYQTWIRWM